MSELREKIAWRMNWYSESYEDWHSMSEKKKRMWRARAGDILAAIEEGIELCPKCEGEKEVAECSNCGGKGWVMK